MADLLTTQTLARWTQSDETEVASDPFAVDLIDKVSQLICFIGGHDGTRFDAIGDLLPEWDLEIGPTQAPIDVQMVALQVIKRSYENPGQVLQAGSVGPLGGDRVADVQALFMDFTDAERKTISKYNPDGDPQGDEGGQIFTLATTRGDDDMLLDPTFGYVSDNQQVGLAESADPRPWMIPLFNPGDPGDPANYDEV